MSNIYRALIKAAEDIDPGQLSVDENKKKLLNISQQYKELGTDVKQDDAVLYKTLQQEDLRKYHEGVGEKSLRHTKTNLTKGASMPLIIKEALFGRKNPKPDNGLVELTARDIAKIQKQQKNNPSPKHWTDDYDMARYLEDMNYDIDKANKYIDEGNTTGQVPSIFQPYRM